MIAKEGTVAAAAETLHLTRPTIASQMRELEKAIGQPLFRKVGRNLRLTDFGQQVFDYAEEIFATGRELQQFIRSGSHGPRQRFTVGIPDVVPKLVAFELLKPALQLPDRPRFIISEGKLSQLLLDLGAHKLDLVLSDAPPPVNLDVRVYRHKLGECGLSMMAVPSLARKYSVGFPESLNDAPCLFPSFQTSVRLALDQWLADQDIFPDVIAEFEDSALLKVFGQSGEGIFPVPSAIELRVQQQYGVEVVGRVPEVRDRFYAISVEKRVQHPATLAVLKQARNQLFEA